MLELKIDRLTKQYQNKIAVDHLEYTFTTGIYGLLGANGAGKTTLLRMICGLLRPTLGEVLCNGVQVEQMGGDYRRLLGYLPQEFGYYPEFTARRFLLYMASLKVLPKETAGDRISEILELVDLAQVSKQKIRTFSGGMIRRLGIAQALLNDPAILILDEPTAGLDPRERIRFRNIISSLSRNRIIILSTHIVSDVEYIADHILMMKKGRLIQTGNMAEVLEPVRGCVWECQVKESEAESFSSRFAVSNLRNTGGGVSLRIVSGVRPSENARPVEPALEDGYLYYFEEKYEGSEEAQAEPDSAAVRK